MNLQEWFFGGTPHLNDEVLRIAVRLAVFGQPRTGWYSTSGKCVPNTQETNILFFVAMAF